jgi:hypothetical protein
MATDRNRNYPWIFWPFVALWDLLAFILKATGRLLAVLLGLLLMVIGIALSATVIGLPIGLPLAIFGFLLLIRGFF